MQSGACQWRPEDVATQPLQPITGVMVGGALGDALGAPLDGQSPEEARAAVPVDPTGLRALRHLLPMDGMLGVFRGITSNRPSRAKRAPIDALHD